MLAALLTGLLPCQDPKPTPPEEPPAIEAPTVVEVWDDRRAKTAASTLTKAFKSRDASMRDRNNALEEIATASNKAFVKPLASIVETDQSIVIRRRAAQLLGNQPAKDANKTIHKLLKNGRVASRHPVMAELVLSLSRCGYDNKQWDDIEDLFEVEYALERVPIQEALLQLIADHKEKAAIALLLRNLDEPIPANPDDPSNPPAEYWEARWKSWQRWRDKVKVALFEITGQRFSTAAEAREWLKKNPLK